MSLEEVKRGAVAQELLENPLLAEALEAFELELIEGWKSTKAEDVAGREKFWDLYQANKRFRLLLETHIETGKLASFQPSKPLTYFERLRQAVGQN